MRWASGAYLSGGLDSSVITALVNRDAGRRLQTFSVTFEGSEFDDSSYQQEVPKLTRRFVAFDYVGRHRSANSQPRAVRAPCLSCPR